MPILALSTAGNPSSYPLLFLHGMLGCKEDFDQIIDFLKEEFYCIAIDLPGHGSSCFDPDVIGSILYTYDSLKLQRGSLIGYSLGGRLAMRIPSFEKRIILSSHPGLDSSAEREERLKIDHAWSDFLKQNSMDAFLEKWYSQSVFSTLKSNKELYEKTLEKRKKNSPTALCYYFENLSLGHQKSLDDFNNFLFLFGVHDIKYRDLYQGLNARAIPNASHAVHLENPKECAEQIRGYLC